MEGIAGLKDQRICCSFHDLYSHHDLAWEQILDIERIIIEVRAVHQVYTILVNPVATRENLIY